ncbi:MAG: SCP2 sterol-binding domain-containing protein [Acidimicrobiia bacterium]
MSFEFLSDEWFEAVEALDAPPVPAALTDVAVNVVVTRDDGDDIEIHLAGGRMHRGLAEGAPTTITAPYDVAKALFVQRDQQAAMQAFMSGQIKVTGDMTPLMMANATPPTPEQQAYADRILDLTAGAGER